MTTPQLIDDLERDEGYAAALPDGRCQAYPDPRSLLAIEMRKPLSERIAAWARLPGAPWTIGFGHTGLDVHPGLIWTRAQALAALAADMATAISRCDRFIPWWRTLDDIRQDVLANMMFNMGWDNLATSKHEGLSSFVNTLPAFRAKNFSSAADHMAGTAWAHETGDRAGRLIHMTRFGARG